MCRRCSEDGQFDACSDCRNASRRELAPAPAATPGSFPFRRDGVEWGRFLRYCFGVYTKNFGLLTLTMITCFGAVLALELIGTLLIAAVSNSAAEGILWTVVPLVHLVAVVMMMVGVLQIALRVSRNEPASLALLWSGLPRLGAFLLVIAATAVAMFGLQVLMFLVFGVGFASLDASSWTLGTLLVAILLGIVVLAASTYVSLGLTFACLEVVAQPGIPVWKALKNAWSIARGERLTLGFGLFLIWLLLCGGLLMCGVGAIFTLGYALVLFASLYLALRNGAPLDDSLARGTARVDSA